MRRGIVVFVQRGCGACHEYLPIIDAARRGHPDVPVVVYDAADRRVWPVLEELKVDETPTTLVLREGKRPKVHAGLLEPGEVAKLFASCKAP